MRLEMHWRQEDGASLPVAVWRAGPGWRMIASGVVGGGLGEREWVLNAQVAPAYSRMDPAAHIGRAGGWPRAWQARGSGCSPRPR